MIRIMDGSDERHVGIQVDGQGGRDGGEDVRAVVELLEESIEKRGPVRVLLRVDSLGGIEPGGFFESLKFSLAHLNDVERAALVGGQAWLRPYARVVDALFPCETRSFEPDAQGAAWGWLREGPAEEES